MTETKFIARDVTFNREGTEIAQVRSIFPIGSSADLIDASVHGDAWKDFRPGQQDGTEGDVVLLFDPADSNHGQLEDDYVAGAVVNYGVADTDSGMDKTFPAILRQLTYGLERDGLIELRCTFKIVSPGITDAS